MSAESVVVGHPAHAVHPVLGLSLEQVQAGPHATVYLAGGCFWGMEQVLWNVPGVLHTSVGYMGGTLPHPTYEQVCTDATGHAETVRVIYDPTVLGAGGTALWEVFWENHNCTQPNQHYGDQGRQYRSEAWCTSSAQYDAALEVRARVSDALRAIGKTCWTTVSLIKDENAVETTFYPAEDYHQAYLHYQPYGYCSHRPQHLVHSSVSDDQVQREERTNRG